MNLASTMDKVSLHDVKLSESGAGGEEPQRSTVIFFFLVVTNHVKLVISWNKKGADIASHFLTHVIRCVIAD